MSTSARERKLPYQTPRVRSFPITSDFADLTSTWVDISEVAEEFLSEYSTATQGSGKVLPEPLTLEQVKSLRKDLP